MDTGDRRYVMILCVCNLYAGCTYWALPSLLYHFYWPGFNGTQRHGGAGGGGGGGGGETERQTEKKTERSGVRQTD